MGPNPYCSNNMDGCDKQKGKKKEKGVKKMYKGTDLMKKK